MQTEKQVIARIDLMLPELKKAIRKKAIELYRSGGLNPDDYSDDFKLPKILMTVILKDQSRQYHPLSADGRATVKNLEHF